MITRRASLRALAVLALVVVGSASVAACKRGGGATSLRIAVIPKGTTHEFWKAVHAGAAKAASETGATIVWKGPLKEDDLKAQIDVVQSFVDQRVSGIVLAPLSDKALAAPVRASVAAGVPVVVFDSDLQGDAHASFVATDNVAAGKLAGAEMVRLLGGNGKVAVLRYQEGSASTTNREKGFLEAVRAAPGITVVSDNQYGGATTESATQASENLLAAERASAGGVDGVFAPNESTTFGMLLALRHASLTKRVKLVGFDASPKLVAALGDGDIDALVVQNPFNIGYLAVKTMVSRLHGESIAKRIDTGATLVTRANMGSADVKELLAPDTKRWLSE